MIFIMIEIEKKKTATIFYEKLKIALIVSFTAAK